MSSCANRTNSIRAADTVVEENRQAFIDFVKENGGGDTYEGYFYNRHEVWMKIHNADTHEVIAEKRFRGNGRAMEYVVEGMGEDPEEFTPDGPKWQLEQERKAKEDEEKAS